MMRVTVVGGDAALPLTKEGICRKNLPRFVYSRVDDHSL